MDIFSFFTKRPKSKDIAKDRLKLVLSKDRGDFSPEKIDAIKEDLAEALSKYVEFDKNDIEISIVNKKESDSNSIFAYLNANTPIRKIK